MKDRKPSLTASPGELSFTRKIVVLRDEIQAWVNGGYLTEIISKAAAKLGDRETTNLMAQEEKAPAMIEELKREYRRLGGEGDFIVPAPMRRTLLERELLGRNDEVYRLQLRVEAATRVGNKELASTSTTRLEYQLGYVRALSKELNRANEELKPGSKIV